MSPGTPKRQSRRVMAPFREAWDAWVRTDPPIIDLTSPPPAT